MTHEELVEHFACEVCGKPQGLSPEDCHSTIGKNNPLCNEHKCCRIEEKSKEQLEYALSSIDQNIFLKACPGSGKTEVVGLRASYEIKRWDKKVGGIAILTFTNNAADIIKNRISQFSGIEKKGYPHFIGTIDSWLHGYIAQPFSHLYTGYIGKDGDHSIRIVDSSSSEGFLNNYKTRYSLSQTGNVLANQYYLDKETDKYIFFSAKEPLDTKRNSTILEGWRIEDLSQTKDKFYEAGFATYQDIENLCFELLRKEKDLVKKLSQRFPLIIIDECQDLSWIQLQILKMIKGAGSTLHFVGDLNQAIFEFRKVDPSKVVSFVEDHKFEKLSLKDNFRSCQPVVDICQQIVNDKSKITGRCKKNLKQPCICITYTKVTMSALPRWFESFLNQNSLDAKGSAIVARNWTNVGHLRPSGNNKINNYQKRLAMAIYLWKTDNIQAIGDALKYTGRFFAEKYFKKYSSNARQYYCPECVSSAVQWRLFLAKVLDQCVQNAELSSLDQTWTNWADCVRKRFGEVARICQAVIENSLTVELSSFNLDSFSALRGASSQLVIESLSVHKPQNTNIRITTIHSVKGGDLEAVMVVSAPSKQGTMDGYWTQWLEDPTSEAARLAYVASSRPKHLLVWAVPEEEEAEYSKLENLGFTCCKIN